MIFAAYIIEHVIHLAMAKIRKDNTPGRENKAHSHRTSHSTWEEDQRPPNLGSRTLGKLQKVREHGLMMSHQMRMKIQVENTTFKLGDQTVTQELYFPDDHPMMPGWFKGMEIII